MKPTNRRLMFHGMVLFVLGLFTGFAEQHFANIRMGLAAHLEGVMNGTFLLALGAAWSGVRLSQRMEPIAFWTVLYGTYANWVMTTLAAVFGTAALSPITGGKGGTPWQETFINAGFMTVGIAILAASIMLIWGFRARAQERQATDEGNVVRMKAAGSKRA
ncbi:MAG TPA: hydrogenase [Terriglobales bacterium]